MIAQARHHLWQRRCAGLLRDLAADQAGSTVLEFSIVAPTFLILLVGTFDIGQMVYGQVVLSGAVEQAARESSLETANTTNADALVRNIVRPVLPGVQVTSTRRNYLDFTDIGRAERFTDTNRNGSCDNNETYVDENSNEQWDTDTGSDGNGSAEDVVVYTVNAQYSPVFKIPFMPEAWNNRTITSTAIKKNQPFANQPAGGSASRICA